MNRKKANPESLELAEWWNKLKTLKKSLQLAVCKGTPARFFKIEKKHLSIFLFRSGFITSRTSQSCWKIWESRHVQENRCPIFWERLKTLTEFFPVWASQKVQLRSKKSVRSFVETLITVRQGICIGPHVKEWKSNNPQDRTYRYLLNFLRKATILFLYRSCWIYQDLFINEKEPLKREWLF